MSQRIVFVMSGRRFWLVSKFTKYQLNSFFYNKNIRQMTPKSIAFLSLVLFFTVHTSIIDPTSLSLLNNTTPDASPNNSNAYDNITLDDLSKMIAEMLAQLNQTQQTHTNIGQQQNTTQTSSTSIQNSTLTPSQEPILDESQPSPQQANPSTVTSGPSGTKNQSISNRVPNEGGTTQEVAVPRAPSDEQTTGQRLSLDDKNNLNSLPKPLQRTAANNTTASSEGQTSNSTINSLLNGNYFTYFVDLNALQTGNIFLNAPNSKQNTNPISNSNSSNTSNNSSNTSNNSSNTSNDSSNISNNNTNSTQQPSSNANDANLNPNSRSTTSSSISSNRPRNVSTTRNIDLARQQNETPRNNTTTVSQTRNNGINATTNSPKPAISSTNNLSRDPQSSQAPASAQDKSSDTTQNRSSIQQSLSSLSYSPNLNRFDLCRSDLDCISFLQLGSSGLRAVCNMGICQPIF